MAVDWPDAYREINYPDGWCRIPFPEKEIEPIDDYTDAQYFTWLDRRIQLLDLLSRRRKLTGVSD